MATKTAAQPTTDRGPPAETIEVTGRMLRTIPDGATVELDYGSVSGLKDGMFRLRFWTETDGGTSEVTIEHKV